MYLPFGFIDLFSSMEIVTLLGIGKSGVNAGVRRNLNLKTLQSMTTRNNCLWQHGKLH